MYHLKKAIYHLKLSIKYAVADRLFSLVKRILGTEDNFYNHALSYNCFTNGHNYILVSQNYVSDNSRVVKLVNRLCCSKCSNTKEISFPNAIELHQKVGV